MNNNPIGLLDSGLGGLTIWKEIVRQLPHESTVYIGDSQNTPYGAKTEAEIYALSKRLVLFLLSKHVKLIVIACNTIMVSCLAKLRLDYPHMPFIGTVPVVKTAATLSMSKRIGILSTRHTAESVYQKELIHTFASDCVVCNEGTDALVPLLEQGIEGSSPQVKQVLGPLLAKFQQEKIDVLALGCTHFPFLRKQIEEVLGPQVQVVDSSGAIARQVTRVLTANDAASGEDHPQYDFYTTGDSAVAKKILQATIKDGVMSGIDTTFLSRYV